MKDIIDTHIHIAGTGDEGSGCMMSKRFKSSLFYYALLILSRKRELSDKIVRDMILGVIESSKRVDRAVVLALDCIVESSGEERLDLSNIVVPNDYVKKLSDEYKGKILFGASIHPYRKNALDLVDKCVEEGAVLIKWVPSAQGIDPQDEKCYRFYDKLAQVGIPLLCHMGLEFAIPSAPDAIFDFNSPKRLIPALERGAKVIAAHCAISSIWNDFRYFNEFLSVMKFAHNRGFSLYADVSAFSNPVKRRFPKRIKDNIDQKRLLFGSDYPVPIFDIEARKALVRIISNWFGKNGDTNPLDKNYEILKEQWEFDDIVFTNAHNILKL